MWLFLLTVGSFLLTVERFLLPVDNFSFFTYSWSVFAYIFSFLTYSWSFLCLQWESESNKGLKGLQAKKLNLSKKAPTVSQKASPPSLYNLFAGGHLKPVTLKPVIRIFRVFASAFSALLLCGVSSNPCFCRVRGAFRIFCIFAVSGSNR